MESGRSTNYWPGFVDALSNMVLAMIFVVLVLALAMGTYATLAAEEIAKRLQAEAAAAAALNGGGGSSAGEAGRAVPAAVPQAAVEPPPSELDKETRVRVARATPPTVGVGSQVRKVRNVLVIEFEKQAVMLDDRSRAELVGALKQAPEIVRSGYADIVAAGPAAQLTESRQTSFYRAMTVRNQLIELGMSPDRINVLVADYDAPGELGEVQIAFRLPAAGSQ
jgi:hypothetical protein